jgi:hypothetical protein
MSQKKEIYIKLPAFGQKKRFDKLNFGTKKRVFEC